MNNNMKFTLAFLFCLAVCSLETFALDKGSKLLMEEVNERYTLKFYGQKMLGGSKGRSAGPNLLQSKGNLEEIIQELFPDLMVVNESRDKKTYEIELRFFVPREEIVMEVAEKLIASLQYEIAAESQERQVYSVSIADLELAQRANDKLPANAKTLSKGKNRELAIYGFPLSEALAEINGWRDEPLFFIEGTSDERIGLELSDMRDLNKLLTELQEQGLTVEQKSKSFETLVIRK
jgi:hypothetical protein